MKQKILFGIIFFTMMWSLPNFAQAVTIIDFDNLPGGGTLAPGSVLTNQYASVGVNFTGFEDAVEVPTYVDATFTNLSPSGGNYWSNIHVAGSSSGDASPLRRDVLRVTFDTPTRDIGFGGWSSLGATFFFYDINDNLIASLSAESDPPWEAIFLFPYTGVKSMEIEQLNDGSLFLVDDLHFHSDPIPEPTTIALLGIGLAGIVGVGVRRKMKGKAVEKS
jgi:hypothetical protein